MMQTKDIEKPILSHVLKLAMLRIIYKKEDMNQTIKIILHHI